MASFAEVPASAAAPAAPPKKLMMAKPMISLRDVTKVFPGPGGGVKALDHVSLDIQKGQIFGIIGLSGAGKSTLLRSINMLERPDRGSIVIDGIEMTSLSPAELRAARRSIGMIFQHFNLLASRTALGNVAFPLEIAGVRKAEAQKKARELLDLVGLSDKENAYPAHLSGGQKQRVGIARALANDPKVLLCDEPTSALDPETTKSILELLRSINAKLGITIVIITHQMDVIKEICNEVAILEGGRVVEQGPVVQVFTHPQTPTAKKFVSSVVSVDVPAEIRERRIVLADEGLEGKILRISFVGESAGRPIISQIVKEFGVDANILYGNIDHIRDIPFGTLVVELTGPNGSVEKAMNYLVSKGLGIEVLNNGKPGSCQAAV